MTIRIDITYMVQNRTFEPMRALLMRPPTERVEILMSLPMDHESFVAQGVQNEFLYDLLQHAMFIQLLKNGRSFTIRMKEDNWVLLSRAYKMHPEPYGMAVFCVTPEEEKEGPPPPSEEQHFKGPIRVHYIFSVLSPHQLVNLPLYCHAMLGELVLQFSYGMFGSVHLDFSWISIEAGEASKKTLLRIHFVNIWFRTFFMHQFTKDSSIPEFFGGIYIYQGREKVFFPSLHREEILSYRMSSVGRNWSYIDPVNLTLGVEFTEFFEHHPGEEVERYAHAVETIVDAAVEIRKRYETRMEEPEVQDVLAELQNLRDYLNLEPHGSIDRASQLCREIVDRFRDRIHNRN